jgi:hypothetical protein
VGEIEGGELKGSAKLSINWTFYLLVVGFLSIALLISVSLHYRN